MPESRVRLYIGLYSDANTGEVDIYNSTGDILCTICHLPNDHSHETALYNINMAIE